MALWARSIRDSWAWVCSTTGRPGSSWRCPTATLRWPGRFGCGSPAGGTGPHPLARSRGERTTWRARPRCRRLAVSPRTEAGSLRVARYPNRFQLQCTGVATASCSLLPTSRVRVVNRCPQPGGELDEAFGEKLVGWAMKIRQSCRCGSPSVAVLPARSVATTGWSIWMRLLPTRSGQRTQAEFSLGALARCPAIGGLGVAERPVIQWQSGACQRARRRLRFDDDAVRVRIDTPTDSRQSQTWDSWSLQPSSSDAATGAS